ncbi:MAG: helix-turn-helix domain-containing protein [Actinomycetota bacterium]|nr:helix-turn-helix domain-containing protein [Actinomycetota bacterium]
MIEDEERCYRAVQSRDGRFDGWFYVAVTSTRIYCRPSCPARTPHRVNMRFYPSAAAAQGAGFRACRRCRPDTAPGSPEWNVRTDLVGRAMRLIADGLVDREGVGGVARRLSVSERHLHRTLVSELGAGPLALARAQRAHTARLLIETTELSFATVAFAAGFASIRQFNDTVRDVFAATPTRLRVARRGQGEAASGAIALRLPVREPFDSATLLRFIGMRAVPGVEELVGDTYRRTVDLTHGDGVVELSPAQGHVACRLRLADLRDLAAAVERCRRLLDLDADPHAVNDVLSADPLLAPLVASAPGRRVPGCIDGSELAVRAVLGQQVSVVGARTIAGRLARLLGAPLSTADATLTLRFPTAASIAAADPALLPMPDSRKRALHGLTSMLAGDAGDGGSGNCGGSGERLVLDPGSDRAEVERRLLALPGIGPWTAGYIAMRALADPDVFLATDLGARHAAPRLGLPASVLELEQRSRAWRPWRSYALQHLWATLEPGQASVATAAAPAIATQ